MEWRARAECLTADAHDAAVLLLDHRRQYRFRDADRVPQIPVNRLLHQLFGEVEQLQPRLEGRVVDEVIDPSEPIERLLRHLVRYSGHAQVAAEPYERLTRL